MPLTDTQFVDGLHTEITLASFPDLVFWEIEITPPGWDGGSPININTLHNVDYDTSVPRKLKTLTPLSMTVAYATSLFEDVVAAINVPDDITLTFPNSAGTLTFRGYIQNFRPGSISEGTRSTATMTIVPTMVDDALVEEAPVFG